MAQHLAFSCCQGKPGPHGLFSALNCEIGNSCTEVLSEYRLSILNNNKRHLGERRVLHKTRSEVDSSQSPNPCAIYQHNLHLVWISSPLVPTHLAPSTVSVELGGRAGQSLFPEVNSE